VDLGLGSAYLILHLHQKDTGLHFGYQARVCGAGASVDGGKIRIPTTQPRTSLKNTTLCFISRQPSERFLSPDRTTQTLMSGEVSQIGLNLTQLLVREVVRVCDAALWFGVTFVTRVRADLCFDRAKCLPRSKPDWIEG
jgi:hypothetical protein